MQETVTETNYHALIEKQRKFFQTGTTLPYTFRKGQLQKLLAIVAANENKILGALYADMRVNNFEGYGLQVGLIINEIRYMLRNLHKWMRSEKRKTPLFHFYTRSYIHKQPYGVSFVIGPWNFPFMLALRPALGAVSAGNCCIIKPSEVTAHTARVIEELINNNFPSEYLHVINTGVAGTQQLLKERFDFIFFTGGTQVGKIVYEAAAKNLTPVALELGGKSPCIVDEDIDLNIAAKRITWGKFMNAGQICVSPDYILVHKNIKDKFIAAIIKNIESGFGKDAQQSNDYGRIVNDAHVNRLEKLLEGTQIIYGGKIDKTDKYIGPTIVEISDPDVALMQEEIFGPVMPIIVYEKTEEIISIVQKNPDPLVLYLFTNNRGLVKKIKEEVSAGDMCVNETVLHFGHLHLPIGGIRNSGVGKYQGKNSFEEFSHKKSVMDRSFFPDLAIRYPPYNERKLEQLKFLMKRFW